LIAFAFVFFVLPVVLLLLVLRVLAYALGIAIAVALVLLTTYRLRRDRRTLIPLAGDLRKQALQPADRVDRFFSDLVTAAETLDRNSHKH
jgi:hypothetical protein